MKRQSAKAAKDWLNWRKLGAHIDSQRGSQLCEVCGQEFAFAGHHILPLSLGGKWTAANHLRVGACHQSLKEGNPPPLTREQQLEIAAARNEKYQIPSDLTGENL